jgi:chromosome segregation ATPase
MPGTQWTQLITKKSSGSIHKYALRPPYAHVNNIFRQLTSHVNGLSGIYEHISAAIRRLQDEKIELQNRVEQLEQDNPSAEMRRLREENSILRAKIVTAAKEKSEIIWERDTLFRKLNSIKQLINSSTVRQPCRLPYF